MATFQCLMQVVGDQIASWLDAPNWQVWRSISTDTLDAQLQHTLARSHQILQMNQLGFLFLELQDPTSMTAVFVITSETLRLMRTTIPRQPFLQQWQPHPAAPETHNTPFLILQSIHEEIFNLAWQGNKMRLARPDLRDRLTTFLMSLTVLTLAEIDKYFLLV